MARSSFPFHGIFSAVQSGSPRPAAPQPQFDEPELYPAQAPAPVQQPTQRQAVGQVAVDIYEQDGYYIIKAPIAGVRMCDLDIEVNDNVLTIRGERRQTDDIDAGQYYLQECFWGGFERKVTLPCSIDPRRVKATFNKESVLKILVPKVEDKVKIIRVGEA